MKLSLTLSTFILSISACTNGSNLPLKAGDHSVTNMTELHHLACKGNARNDKVWGKNSLYDCQSKKLYVPYQLWTGAKWDGQKSNNCVHTANSAFNVDGDSPTTIKGPSKSQYFTCHDKGIGRVYDSRRSRTYLSGRCKFPAGEGWSISKRRHCKDTSIEIIEMIFDKNGVLQSMRFKWWTAGYFDHIYRYKPNYGMSDAWKQ